MDNGRFNKWEDVNEETLFLAGPEDTLCDVNLVNFDTLSSLMCADCRMTPTKPQPTAICDANFVKGIAITMHLYYYFLLHFDWLVSRKTS